MAAGKCPLQQISEIQGIQYFSNIPPGSWRTFVATTSRIARQARSPRDTTCMHNTGEGWAVTGMGVNSCLSARQQLGLGLLHAARSLLYAGADYDVAFHTSNGGR